MLQEVVQNFLVTVVTGVLGVLSAFLIALAKKGFDWLSAKIENVKNRTAQEKLSAAMTTLQELVTNVVVSLQQTVGDNIKKSLEEGDGQYTKEDLYKLKDEALTIIFNQLSDGFKEILSETFGDLEGFISDMIESQVRAMKSSEECLTTSRVLLG